MPSANPWRVPGGREPIPERSFAYFGAQTAHSPAREDADPADCPLCGGMREAPNGRLIPNWPPGADPIQHYEEMVDTCGNCRRTDALRERAVLGHAKPDDGKLREGYEHLATPDADPEGRTAAAVRGADQKPLSRAERRALQFPGRRRAKSLRKPK